MAIEKTKAFVLKTLPYRETSGIFYLLTERQGIVHGIAKGIRKKKASACFLERGFLIETLIYSKPHRELHTLGDIHIVTYYPAIRKDLIKSALRDAVFETFLTNVSAGFPVPELFSLATRFLVCLEQQKGNTPALLWSFYYEFSAFLGYRLNCDACVSCGRNFSVSQAAYLVYEKGGFACDRCVGQKDMRHRVPPPLLKALALSDDCTLAEGIETLPAAERRCITRLFASYCHYHSETASDYKALEFLDSLLFSYCI